MVSTLVHVTLSRLAFLSVSLHEFEVNLVGVVRFKLLSRCRVRMRKRLLLLLNRLEEDCVTVDSVGDFDDRRNRDFSLISFPLNGRIVLDSVTDLVLIGAPTLSLILMKLSLDDDEFILLLLFKLVEFFHFYF